MQEICKCYRNKQPIRPDQRFSFETAIIGLVYTHRKDEKVRKWSMNALARLGREESMDAVKHVLKDFEHEPQTMAAAIAAVYRLSRKPEEVLAALKFDPQMRTLAALQHISPASLDLRALPIEIDSASTDILKLALVVVGLNRAPSNMLNPRHSNAEMVRALGGHHDETVSQYTVWAITENHALSLRNLGVPIKDIERQPANVRAWIFQLLAMDEDDAAKHVEYLVLGASDHATEARGGLALGLKDTYFDGLEAIALDWIMTEPDVDVRHLLLEHMTRQAGRCPSYESLVLDVYETEPTGSMLRKRLEATAAGSLVYTKMKQIDLGGLADLFGGGGTSVTNNFTVNGNVQTGALSVGGDAENIGQVLNSFSTETSDKLRATLAKAESILLAIQEIEGVSVATSEVQAAKADPSLSKVSTAIAALKGLSSAIAIGEAVAPIATELAKIIGIS